MGGEQPCSCTQSTTPAPHYWSSIDVNGGIVWAAFTLTRVRALEDPRARRFPEECCRRYRCVVSDVHRLEPWRDETIRTIGELLAGLNACQLPVNISRLTVEADRLVREHGWSSCRRLDLMHVLAALELGCRAIAAVDCFIARRAKEYGLLYVDHYVGCP